ncbi:MAG: hypothetical protein J3K34DRAFT_522950 [Monoraphidium minutum]|nr:MAG: hypothetical protein J3K34DRAFT_522950 [Monoraphidium minutum]
MARARPQPGGLTLADRALHLAASSAQRLSGAGLGAKLLALAGLAAANIAAGAAAYRLATGDDWPSSLFTIYGVLLRAPGFTVRGAPNNAGTLVLNAVLIYSVFVFAIVLGAGIEEVKARFSAVRDGEVGLRLQQHVLVLNWSPLAVPLLRQLAAARLDPASPLHRRPVVLLADAPKPALDGQLAEALKGAKLELYARSGQPWRLGDLQRVCAPDAAVILLLEPLPPAAGAPAPAAAAAAGAAAAAAAAAAGLAGGGDPRSPEPTGGGAGAAPPLAPAGSVAGGGGAAAALAAAADAALGPDGGGGGGGDGDQRQQALKAAALMALMTLLGPSGTGGGGGGGGGGPAFSRWPHSASSSPPAAARSGGSAAGAPRSDGGGAAGGWRAALRRAAAASGGGAGAPPGASAGGAAGGGRRPRRGAGPRVVVQVPSVGGAGDFAHLVQRSAFLGAFGCDVTLAESSLNQSSLVDRLVVQTALQPGLASVCREALRQGPGSAAFRYARAGPALAGAPFADAWRLCRGGGAWLVGVVCAADGRLVLNPPPAMRLRHGDELVGLARGANILPARTARARPGLPGLGAPAAPARVLSRASTMSSEDLLCRHRASGDGGGASEDLLCRHRASGDGGGAAAAGAAGDGARAPPRGGARPPVRVIVAGCGAAQRKGLAEGFRRQAPPGSSVVFVHSDAGCGADLSEEWGPAPPPPRAPPAPGGGPPPPLPPPAVAVRELYAPRPTAAAALLAAGAGAADALVLASRGGPAGGFGAAAQAADAQLLYGMRRTAKAFLHAMLRRAFSFELLIGDELMSAALVQIATHPHNRQVFERLLLARRGGPQLAMAPAAAYGFGRGASAAFGDVAEAVLRARGLALGYRRADGRMLLAPAPGDAVDWGDGDELVVMVDQDG